MAFFVVQVTESDWLRVKFKNIDCGGEIQGWMGMGSPAKHHNNIWRIKSIILKHINSTFEVHTWHARTRGNFQTKLLAPEYCQQKSENMGVCCRTIRKRKVSQKDC